MDNSLRSITETTCPCCGRLIPVEIVLSAAGIEEYVETILVQPMDTEDDLEKPWPVLTVEVEIDTKELLQNNQHVKQYHAKMVKIGMASPVNYS